MERLFLSPSRAMYCRSRRVALVPLLVALAVAPACRAESFRLEDVPIEGGTAEQRRAARAELDRLADAFTTPPELSLVLFDEVDGFYGAYRHRDRRVRVDVSVEPESVAGVVRHEACHALYEQISTLELDSADAERVVDDAADIDDYGGRRRTQSEAYAIVCGWGEDGLAAAHTACGPEERPHVALAALVGEDAYGALSGVDDGWRTLSFSPVDMPLIQVILGYEDGRATIAAPDGEASVVVDVASERVVDEEAVAQAIQPLFITGDDIIASGDVLDGRMHASGRGLAVLRPGGMHYWRVLSRQSSGAGWRFGRCLEQGESAAIGVVSDDGVWLGLSGAGAEATVLGLE